VEVDTVACLGYQKRYQEKVGKPRTKLKETNHRWMTSRHTFGGQFFLFWRGFTSKSRKQVRSWTKVMLAPPEDSKGLGLKRWDRVGTVSHVHWKVYLQV
jgi:hypothetical protein